MNYLEFDLYRHCINSLYVLCKDFFCKGWCRKIVKSRDAQGHITKRKKTINQCEMQITSSINWTRVAWWKVSWADGSCLLLNIIYSRVHEYCYSGDIMIP